MGGGMAIGAVIFDCDGVLVDSEPLANRVIRDNLAARGLDWSVEDVMRRFVGGTIAGIAPVAEAHGARLEKDWVPALYAEIFEVLAREVAPVPGAPGVLDALDAAGVPHAVGSNGPVRKMEITLGRCGMLDRLSGRILSAQEVGRVKPAPDVYLAAARLLGVAPADAVVIEDSATGARAAAAAGMRCLGYAPDGDGAALRAEGAEIFRDMADLPGRLGL